MGLRRSRVDGRWMLERLPRRVIAVSGFVGPAALALLGMAVVAGGCAKEGETAPINVATSVAARVPVGGVHAKDPSRAHWGARTLAALANAGTSLLPSRPSQGLAVTPLDQLLGEGDRPL